MTKALTVNDICDILRIGKTQAYALMHNDTFPSYRIGNKMFITEEALDDWLRKIQNKSIIV